MEILSGGSIGFLGGEVWVWSLRWRQVFLVWEKELFEDFIATISSVFRQGREDVRVWKLYLESGFSVRST